MSIYHTSFITCRNLGPAGAAPARSVACDVTNHDECLGIFNFRNVPSSKVIYEYRSDRHKRRGRAQGRIANNRRCPRRRPVIDGGRGAAGRGGLKEIRQLLINGAACAQCPRALLILSHRVEPERPKRSSSGGRPAGVRGARATSARNESRCRRRQCARRQSAAAARDRRLRLALENGHLSRLSPTSNNHSSNKHAHAILYSMTCILSFSVECT